MGELDEAHACARVVDDVLRRLHEDRSGQGRGTSTQVERLRPARDVECGSSGRVVHREKEEVWEETKEEALVEWVLYFCGEEFKESVFTNGKK
jgi:hypothetical protein